MNAFTVAVFLVTITTVHLVPLGKDLQKICCGQPNFRRVASDDCSCLIYYQCYAGLAHVTRCPNGTWFNEEEQICDRSAVPGRCGGVTEAKSVPEKADSEEDDSEEDDSDEDDAETETTEWDTTETDTETESESELESESESDAESDSEVTENAPERQCDSDEDTDKSGDSDEDKEESSDSDGETEESNETDGDTEESSETEDDDHETRRARVRRNGGEFYDFDEY